MSLRPPIGYADDLMDPLTRSTPTKQRILLLTSHSIAEYDDLRMLTDLGYDVFSIGAYTDPSSPTDNKRPALPEVPYYADLAERCEQVRRENDDPGPAIDWAKGKLHPDIIDWADTIIVHHFPERWIGDQWGRIRHKRVIWRTCGQSDPRLETVMAPLRKDGVQIVRYSPAEERAFRRLGMWAGQDALIRFGKYPGDYGPYDGSTVAIGNITQDMVNRGEACGLDRWNRITAGLAVQPAGPGSMSLRDGIGALSYDEMLDYLRRIRVYLYLGTQPASYTLGLMEAMLSGVPVVPVPWQAPGLDWRWLAELWEANEIVPSVGLDDPQDALRYLMRHLDAAVHFGGECRQRAIELFDVATVGAQWRAFLG